MQKKYSIKRNSIKKSVKVTSNHDDAVAPSGVTKKTYSDEMHINIITATNIDTSNISRLRSPIDSEKHEFRKRRHAVKNLTLKSAPPIPTAPKDPKVRFRQWIYSQIKTHIRLIDLPLFLMAVLLSLCGVFAIFSATKSYETTRFIIVQIFGIILGVFCSLILSVIDYRSLSSKYTYIIGINAAILLITFIFGSSVTESTNSNWIDLGFIKIQPSEFSKLLFIYSFAVHLASLRDKMHKFWPMIPLAIHAGIIFGLVLLQKDLGSLTIFLIIFICMCFSAGVNIWYYIGGGAAVFCISPFIWSHLNEYQRNRILLCFDETIDPLGKGIRYQQLQSQRAIGNGGIFGTGFTNGSITQFEGSLPAKHTDMIYSTVCEEWGLIGACIILSLTVFLAYRAFRIALSCGNTTGRYICVGVASMLMIQIIENVGMCLGIMPVIGITYPFLSYGGSSILSCFLALGMVLSVSTHRENTFFK